MQIPHRIFGMNKICQLVRRHKELSGNKIEFEGIHYVECVTHGTHQEHYRRLE